MGCGTTGENVQEYGCNALFSQCNFGTCSESPAWFIRFMEWKRIVHFL